MSLGPKWFEDGEKKKRFSEYPLFDAERWKTTLAWYWSTIWPVGEEAAHWLRDNYTDDHILMNFGIPTYQMMCEILKLEVDSAKLESIKEAVTSRFMKAREEINLHGIDDELLKKVEGQLQETAKKLKVKGRRLKQAKEQIGKLQSESLVETYDLRAKARYERRQGFAAGLLSATYACPIITLTIVHQVLERSRPAFLDDVLEFIFNAGLGFGLVGAIAILASYSILRRHFRVQFQEETYFGRIVQ